MKRRLEVRLRGAVGAGLSIAILLVTVAMGITVYRDLYEVIIDGFSRKLEAISTTTGSFISGDEHRALETADRIRGLTWDPGARRLYQVEPVSRMLIEIDPRAGTARPLAAVALEEVRALAWAPERELLAALVPEAGERWLFALDRDTGEATRVGDVGFADCAGLAWDGSTEAFYCVAAEAGHLVRIDPASGRGRRAAALDASFELLAAGPAGGLVGFALVDDGRGGEAAELRRIDLASGASSRRLGLDRRDWMNGLFGLAWEPAEERGWLLTDRLLELEAAGGTVVASPWRPPVGELYQTYSVAMRGTLARAGITYLYTQVAHPEPDRCIYILNADCTTDHLDHTPLGAEDTLPPESVLGQRDVLSRASIFLSSVRAWEQWGLLKNAFAPIFDESGEVSAIAGADVNISIIRAKTRQALLQVFGLGVVFFLAGLLVSIIVAGRIVGPIAEVKEAALRFGAGRFEERIAGSRLRELDQLARAFNGLGERLEATVRRMLRANQELEQVRRLREMEEHLSGLLAAEQGDPDPSLAWTVRDEPEAASASGVVRGEAGSLVWLAPGLRPRGEAMKRRFEIGTRLRAEIERGEEGLWKRLERLHPASVEVYLWVPRGGAEVRWLARGELTLRLHGGAGGRAVAARDRGRVALEPGEILTLGEEADAVEAALAAAAGEPGPPSAYELLKRLRAVAGDSRWGLTLVVVRDGPAGGGAS